MENVNVVEKLNIRRNAKKETYSAYSGKNAIAKNMDLHGGVWKITFNNESVDWYKNDDGQVVYILTNHANDTKQGLFFETVDDESKFLERFKNCINTTDKMISLISFIKDAYI